MSFRYLMMLAVDLTVKATISDKNASANASDPPSAAPSANASTSDLFQDAERGIPIAPKPVPISVRSIVSGNGDGGSVNTTNEAAPSIDSAATRFTYLKNKTSQLFNIGGSGSSSDRTTAPGPKLDALVSAYQSSHIAEDIKKEMNALVDEVGRTSGNGVSHDANGGAAVSNEPPDAVLETSLLRGRKRASWGTQFRILSGRAFKNLYRDPALLAAHYLSAIGLAGE
jgi:hypothetical protein